MLFNDIALIGSKKMSLQDDRYMSAGSRNSSSLVKINKNDPEKLFLYFIAGCLLKKIT